MNDELKSCLLLALSYYCSPHFSQHLLPSTQSVLAGIVYS